jgi:hypothetical protein
MVTDRKDPDAAVECPSCPREAPRARTKRLADRAALLRDRGLSLSEIGRDLGLTSSYVSSLIRYSRFLSGFASGIDVRISRFQQCWKAVSDPHVIRRMVGPRKRIDRDYEDQCLSNIAAMIREGLLPVPRHHSRASQGPDARDLRSIAELREQIELRMREVRPTLEKLEGMLHAGRLSYAPTMLAAMAVLLRRQFGEVETLLAGFGGREGPTAPDPEP